MRISRLFLKYLFNPVAMRVFCTFISLVAVFQCVYGKLRRSILDKNVNLFSDEGELLQVQYARKAGLQGGSVVCATSASSEVFICIPNPTELPILLDRRSVDKVSKIDDDIWFAFAGLAGDGRALISQARKYCIDYRSQFGCSPTGRNVASIMGQLQHEATLTGNKRPYGVQLLIFAYNSESHLFDIYQCDPTGEVSKWSATAIGKNSPNYLKDLEKDWNKSLTNDEVVDLISKNGASSESVSEGEDKESKPALVHRMFFRLHRVGETSKLSYHQNKEDLLTSFTAELK